MALTTHLYVVWWFGGVGAQPQEQKIWGVGVRLPFGCVYINLINIYRVKPSTAVVGSLATTTFVDTLSPGRAIAPHAQRRWHCAARPLNNPASRLMSTSAGFSSRYSVNPPLGGGILLS